MVNLPHFIAKGLVQKDVKHFDFILAMGLLHHLNDKESSELFQLGLSSLKYGGKMIFLDGVFTSDQGRLARFILKKDRGKYVRTETQYKTLAQKHFTKVESIVLSDLFYIPYTACILTCRKS